MNVQNAFEYLTGKKVYTYEDSVPSALQCASEAVVMLENKKGCLPLKENAHICLYGRMQKQYLIAGTGSGGRVNPPYTTNIADSLKEAGISLDTVTEEFYDNFVKENPYDSDNGWTHPWSQKEPELEQNFVAEAAGRCDTAVIVITRTAGEDKDLVPRKGSYYLSETEENNISIIRRNFAKVCILLNVCGIIDMSWVEKYGIDSVLYLWNGGMTGGKAAAQVLTGKATPCGKLPDTIPVSRDVCPAAKNYGSNEYNCYAEDIYVGYRYYNTFAKQDIAYPFGYGLSYTDFDITVNGCEDNGDSVTIRFTVKNTGSFSGKQVVQCYCRQPQGVLGKPESVLGGFYKTPLLSPEESCEGCITVPNRVIASYDDSGKTGNRYCYLLEKGDYTYCIGTSSADNTPAFTKTLKEDIVLKQCQSALAPVRGFERIFNKNGVPEKESVPTREREYPLPVLEDIPYSGDKGITLYDVADGKREMKEFLAQLTDKELCCIVRGEGMNSPKVTPGTGAAFGGVTKSLCEKKIPTMCCTDGPSGVRMVSDAKCFSYPSATAIAATWNEEIAEDMYLNCGNELASYGVDMLLGPGTNIHRDPMCGRNFEYFSEDPLLAGKMCAAVSRGLEKAGVSGVVKHFLANNQEQARHDVDSVISERAVREIYAFPFYITVTESGIRSVMTSYNPVNGKWAAGNPDLTIGILRDDYGFDGFVMSDWWAKISDDDGKGGVTNLKAMVKAQNDVYMVTPDAETRDDNLEKSLEDGLLTRAQLGVCAEHICRYAIDSLSFKAMREGYGAVDPKSLIEGKAPVFTSDVTDGKAVFNSESARRAVLAVEIISDTPALTQSDIQLIISTKNAATYTVGGTDGKTTTEYRIISLISGNNEMSFVSESDKVKVVKVQIY